MTLTTDILDWKALVKDLARDRLFVSYEANNKELDAIKLGYDLHAAHDFRAEMELKQIQSGLIKVTGKLAASVEQVCVVTLKPVAENMAFTYDRLFALDRGKGVRKRDRRAGSVVKTSEAVFEPLGDDPPDIIRGKTIDLGKIALEEFALQLNPYPRHDTAEMAVSGSNDDVDRGATGVRPFAKLQKYQINNSGD